MTDHLLDHLIRLVYTVPGRGFISRHNIGRSFASSTAHALIRRGWAREEWGVSGSSYIVVTEVGRATAAAHRDRT